MVTSKVCCGKAMYLSFTTICLFGDLAKVFITLELIHFALEQQLSVYFGGIGWTDIKLHIRRKMSGLTT